MGKLFPTETGVNRLGAVASKLVKTPKSTRPVDPKSSSKAMEGTSTSSAARETTTSGGGGNRRVPLSAVVADCAKRWFKDTLQEAKAGDISMQVLVGQMYYSGYGIPRDAKKGKLWMTKASRTRSSVWKVSDKPPGYNASDSDSDEMKSNS